MGYSNWSSDAYSHLRKSRAGKSVDDIFTNNRTNSASSRMSPHGVAFRESRDSDAHPESLAISVFLDVTGSMGVIPEILVREKLGTLMDTLLAHNVQHPQILFGAIGDHISDRFPLQIGQYESGTAELDQWLTEIYLEGGGGGQNKESYLLAYQFCAKHTSMDCFEKRQQKGFLFTMGDEASWDTLNTDALKNIFGYTQADTVTDREILNQVSRMYHVFHIHINQGSYHNDSTILGYWRKLLGERLIVLDDYNKVAEVIASTVAVMCGANLNTVANSFDNDTATTLKTSLSKIGSLVTSSNATDGVISL
ncbi:MAG: hypothetical protein IPN94_09035 [Sphingobacteriales bacterium]|jgi:hypothetical protein|nr:hypothetical protein [Sphingobacteriales bacterium]